MKHDSEGRQVETGPKQRGKGDGSVYFSETQHRWCATVTLPPIDGKRRRKTAVAATREEAEIRLVELRQLRDTLRLAELRKQLGEPPPQ